MALVSFDVFEVTVNADAGCDFVVKALPCQRLSEFDFNGILVFIQEVENALVPVFVAGIDVDFSAAVIEIDDDVAIKAIGSFDGTTNPVVGGGRIDGEQAVH